MARRPRTSVLVVAGCCALLVVAVAVPVSRWASGRWDDWTAYRSTDRYARSLAPRIGAAVYSSEPPCRSSTGGRVELDVAADDVTTISSRIASVVSTLESDGWVRQPDDVDETSVFWGSKQIGGQEAQVDVQQAMDATEFRVIIHNGDPAHCFLGVL